MTALGPQAQEALAEKVVTAGEHPLPGRPSVGMKVEYLAKDDEVAIDGTRIGGALVRKICSGEIRQAHVMISPADSGRLGRMSFIPLNCGSPDSETVVWCRSFLIAPPGRLLNLLCKLADSEETTVGLGVLEDNGSWRVILFGQAPVVVPTDRVLAWCDPLTGPHHDPRPGAPDPDRQQLADIKAAAEEYGRALRARENGNLATIRLADTVKDVLGFDWRTGKFTPRTGDHPK